MKKTFEAPSLAEAATLVDLTLQVQCSAGHTPTGAPC